MMRSAKKPLTCIATPLLGCKCGFTHRKALFADSDFRRYAGVSHRRSLPSQAFAELTVLQEMEDVHYGHDDEMDEDAEDEDEDAEMYDDEETGSEDTSATDEEDEEALENELEDETGDSEGGWNEEEEEEDLVENEAVHEEGDEDSEDEDEVGDEAEVMWQVGSADYNL